jgi:DNA-binding NarL/FixJ family response regulator
MSSAIAGQAEPPAPQGAATVVDGDDATRRRAMRLLSEAGFELSAQPRFGALVILLSRAGDSERVRAVRASAEAHPDARILAVMSSGAANASLRRALLAGAKGIIFDDDLDRALVPTARAMLAGQLAVPSALSRQIAPRPLSYREKQIMRLVVLGSTNREIAHKLYLAESTVKTHLSSAFRKLDARSRSEAVARILDPDVGYGMGILAYADGNGMAERAAG